jgi:hypothetical protein
VGAVLWIAAPNRLGRWLVISCIEEEDDHYLVGGGGARGANEIENAVKMLGGGQ